MVMHWDDLQLLQMIDHLEESEIGTLTNGQGLMQRIADGQQLDYSRDYRTFAWELLLAYDAGFVTWDERGVYPQSAYPLANPNSWLQQIRDIRLTLAGRRSADRRYDTRGDRAEHRRLLHAVAAATILARFGSP
jgi:hypothetical protein